MKVPSHVNRFLLWAGAAILWAALLAGAFRPNPFNVASDEHILFYGALFIVVTRLVYSALPTRKQFVSIAMFMSGIVNAFIVFVVPELIRFVGWLLV